jgi:phosphohistidine phosphatase
MKTLHLLRHAKSSWKHADLDDHERPLSKRGRQTAKSIAADLRRAKIAPDLVICSTAVRARQTLDPIGKALKPPKVVLERGLYEVAQQKIWKHLWKLPESADCVLLIGHNPGLHDLALELADADSAKLVPPRGGKFPTGALASFRFDGAWKAIQPHSAVLLSFTRPKAMKKEGRSMTAERTVKQVAKANKKVSKAASVTQPAKEMTKANKTATRTTVQRTRKATTPTAKPKRVTPARKAPPKVARAASKVARQSSAMTSITPRPVTLPAGSVRPSTPTARGTSDQQPRQIPLSDEIERDSQDSFPASDAPSWTPITRIGTPIPPKRA